MRNAPLLGCSPPPQELAALEARRLRLCSSSGSAPSSPGTRHRRRRARKNPTPPRPHRDGTGDTHRARVSRTGLTLAQRRRDRGQSSHDSACRCASTADGIAARDHSFRVPSHPGWTGGVGRATRAHPANISPSRLIVRSMPSKWSVRRAGSRTVHREAEPDPRRPSSMIAPSVRLHAAPAFPRRACRWSSRDRAHVSVARRRAGMESRHVRSAIRTSAESGVPHNTLRLRRAPSGRLRTRQQTCERNPEPGWPWRACDTEQRVRRCRCRMPSRLL